MSATTTTTVQTITVPTRNPFTPDATIMARPFTARNSRDARGVTFTWKAREGAEGEKVEAVEVTVYWVSDAKCYTAVARPVTVENDHGMTITTIANLVGGDTLQARSEYFPRFNRAKLDAFATAARAWLIEQAA